jgi:hypothetical protein
MGGGGIPMPAGGGGISLGGAGITFPFNPIGRGGS